MSDTSHFDILIIGSGGGTKLALPAAELGLRVALVEDDAFGGTCLNRGCIPSKMMIYPAEVMELARAAARLGIRNLSNPQADFAAIVTRINGAVDAISAENRAAHGLHPGLTLITGHARFCADKAVRVGEHTLTAERLFIATGSRPQLPTIPGLAGTPYWTSTDALRNTQLPRRLLILGGGYIATELGFAYGAFGTDVQMVVRSSLLRHEDHDIAAEFARVFRRHHAVLENASVERVDHQDGIFRLRVTSATGSQILEGDALLVATGIVPNTDDLGLEHTGIRRNAKGFIEVDDHLRTAAPGVYALGDCNGRHLFRHTVNYEGEYLMRTAVRGNDHAPLDYGPVPHAVFSQPQIAAVGPTESQLRTRGADYVAGVATYASSTPGEARLLDYGLVKLLVDRATRRLLAAHIVGDEAATLLHLVVAMMKMAGTLDDLLDMIFIHPALPEVVRNAARDARRQLPTLT
jgi:mycothione reductase